MSRPREGYEFVLPAVTYRLTSALIDHVINGQTYRAGTIRRGEVTAGSIDAPHELEVTMLVSHALPQRYLRGGIPPRRIDVNVYRKQLTSGEFRQVFAGRVQAVSCDGHLAKVLCSSRITEAMPRRIPTISVGKECAHILYDQNCRADRNAFKVATTITGIDGAKVNVAAIGGKPDGWANVGELVHVSSGERMTISRQIGTEIIMQVPIVELQHGDAVEIYAGCDHQVGTCFTKFANQPNYGGMPQLPHKNPFVNKGYASIWELLS